MCESGRYKELCCASNRTITRTKKAQIVMGFQRLTVAFATSGVLAGALWMHRDIFQFKTAKAKSYGLEEAIEQYKKGKHKWNPDWDHRATTSTDQTDGESGEKKVSKSVAKRHLFLIRHGQYEMWHKDSSLKKLTALGREQAKETGKRLKLLNYDYGILYYSTMPRATETADIIRYQHIVL